MWPQRRKGIDMLRTTDTVKSSFQSGLSVFFLVWDLKTLCPLSVKTANGSDLPTTQCQLGGHILLCEISDIPPRSTARMSWPLNRTTRNKPWSESGHQKKRREDDNRGKETYC